MTATGRRLSKSREEAIGIGDHGGRRQNRGGNGQRGVSGIARWAETQPWISEYAKLHKKKDSSATSGEVNREKGRKIKRDTFQRNGQKGRIHRQRERGGLKKRVEKQKASLHGPSQRNQRGKSRIEGKFDPQKGEEISSSP